MKKRILFIAFVVLAAFLFAACQPSPHVQTPAQSKGVTYEITNISQTTTPVYSYGSEIILTYKIRKRMELSVHHPELDFIK